MSEPHFQIDPSVPQADQTVTSESDLPQKVDSVSAESTDVQHSDAVLTTFPLEEENETQAPADTAYSARQKEIAATLIEVQELQQKHTEYLEANEGKSNPEMLESLAAAASKYQLLVDTCPGPGIQDLHGVEYEIYSDQTGMKVFAMEAPDLESEDDVSNQGCLYGVFQDNQLTAMIPFRRGNFAIHGPTGFTSEAFIEMLLHRTRVKNGEVPCEENVTVIHHLQAALKALHSRQDRIRREREAEVKKD